MLQGYDSTSAKEQLVPLLNDIERLKTETSNVIEIVERSLGKHSVDRLQEYFSDLSSASRIIKGILWRLVSPINIAIIGEYNSGKSSLINSLLNSFKIDDENTIRGVKNAPETKKISILSHVRSSHEEVFSSAFPEWDDYIEIIKVDHPLFYELNIIDTPGTGHKIHHDQRVKEFLYGVDCIIFLVGHNFPSAKDIIFINDLTDKIESEKIIFIQPRDDSINCFPPFVINQYKDGIDLERLNWLDKKIKAGISISLPMVDSFCQQEILKILNINTIAEALKKLSSENTILDESFIYKIDEITSCFRKIYDDSNFVDEQISAIEVDRISKIYSHEFDNKVKIKLNDNFFFVDSQKKKSVRGFYNALFNQGRFGLDTKKVEIKKDTQRGVAKINHKVQSYKYNFSISKVSLNKSYAILEDAVQRGLINFRNEIINNIISEYDTFIKSSTENNFQEDLSLANIKIVIENLREKKSKIEEIKNILNKKSNDVLRKITEKLTSKSFASMKVIVKPIESNNRMVEDESKNITMNAKAIISELFDDSLIFNKSKMLNKARSMMESEKIYSKQHDLSRYINSDVLDYIKNEMTIYEREIIELFDTNNSDSIYSSYASLAFELIKLLHDSVNGITDVSELLTKDINKKNKEIHDISSKLLADISDSYHRMIKQQRAFFTPEDTANLALSPYIAILPKNIFSFKDISEQSEKNISNMQYKAIFDLDEISGLHINNIRQRKNDACSDLNNLIANTQNDLEKIKSRSDKINKFIKDEFAGTYMEIESSIKSHIYNMEKQNNDLDLYIYDAIYTSIHDSVKIIKHDVKSILLYLIPILIPAFLAILSSQESSYSHILNYIIITCSFVYLSFILFTANWGISFSIKRKINKKLEEKIEGKVKYKNAVQLTFSYKELYQTYLSDLNKVSASTQGLAVDKIKKGFDEINEEIKKIMRNDDLSFYKESYTNDLSKHVENKLKSILREFDLFHKNKIFSHGFARKELSSFLNELIDSEIPSKLKIISDLDKHDSEAIDRIILLTADISKKTNHLSSILDHKNEIIHSF